MRLSGYTFRVTSNIQILFETQSWKTVVKLKSTKRGNELKCEKRINVKNVGKSDSLLFAYQVFSLRSRKNRISPLLV